jgi:hypothetical protein
MDEHDDHDGDQEGNDVKNACAEWQLQHAQEVHVSIPLARGLTGAAAAGHR